MFRMYIDRRKYLVKSVSMLQCQRWRWDNMFESTHLVCGVGIAVLHFLQSLQFWFMKDCIMPSPHLLNVTCVKLCTWLEQPCIYTRLESMALCNKHFDTPVQKKCHEQKCGWDNHIILCTKGFENPFRWLAWVNTVSKDVLSFYCNCDYVCQG